MIQSTLLIYTAIGAVLAEVAGWCAFLLWQEQQLVIGLSPEAGIWRPSAILALVGACAGLAAYGARRARHVR